MPDVEDVRPLISRELAVSLCSEVRQERGGKWYNFLPGQCWGCMRSSKGVPEKMCMYDGAGYGGCSLVNRKYAEQAGSGLYPREGS